MRFGLLRRAFVGPNELLLGVCLLHESSQEFGRARLVGCTCILGSLANPKLRCSWDQASPEINCFLQVFLALGFVARVKKALCKANHSAVSSAVKFSAASHNPRCKSGHTCGEQRAKTVEIGTTRKGPKTVENGRKRSKTVQNARKRSKTVQNDTDRNGQNVQKRPPRKTAPAVDTTWCKRALQQHTMHRRKTPCLSMAHITAMGKVSAGIERWHGAVDFILMQSPLWYNTMRSTTYTTPNHLGPSCGNARKELGNNMFKGKNYNLVAYRIDFRTETIYMVFFELFCAVPLWPSSGGHFASSESASSRFHLPVPTAVVAAAAVAAAVPGTLLHCSWHLLTSLTPATRSRSPSPSIPVVTRAPSQGRVLRAAGPM